MDINNASKAWVKVYIPENDVNRNYRIDEIRPEVLPYLNAARKRRGVFFISPGQIDEIIRYQKEDIEKCCTFIEWKYLGTKTYMDVFSPTAEKIREERRTLEQLQRTVAELKEAIEALNAKKIDVQKNVQHKSVDVYIQ